MIKRLIEAVKLGSAIQLIPSSLSPSVMSCNHVKGHVSIVRKDSYIFEEV